MRKIMKTGAGLLLAVITVLALLSCPQDEPVLSSNAELVSVTLAGKTVVLGTPSANWMDAKDSAGVVFLTAGQMQNAQVAVRKGQSGQKIYYASAKPSVMPVFVEDTAFAFDLYDFLWIEVFSENHDAFNLYAVEVKTTTPTVLDLTLDGRSASGGQKLNGQPIKQYGTGLGTYSTNLAGVVEGGVWFGKDQENTSLAVTVTPEDPDTQVLVALGENNTSLGTLFPDGYINPIPFEFTVTNGKYLYIKAASADAEQGETIYYKVKLISKETGFGISDVTMTVQGGSPVDFGVGAAGTLGFGGGENRANAANLAGGGAGYKNISSTAGTASVTVDIGTKPAGATFRYGRTDWDAAQENVPSTGHVTLIYQNSATISNVATNDYIAVEITNELGDKCWYSFRVRLGNPNAELGGVTVAGYPVITVGMTAGTVIPGNFACTDKKGNISTEALPSFTGTSGTVDLTEAEAVNVAVTAISSSAGAAIRYGYLKDKKVPLDQWGFVPGIDYSTTSRVIDWNTTGLIPTVIETPLGDDVETVIGIGGYIVIEVTPQDKGAPSLYVIIAEVSP